jgi:hypothetical protein
MTRQRATYWALIAGFAVIIGSVGIVQATIEYRRDEPIQALEIFRVAPTVPNLRAYEKEMKRVSWFAGTLRPIVAYRRFEWLGDTGAKAIQGRDGWWFYRPGVRYLTEPLPDRTSSHHGFEPAVEAILDFRDQLRQRGIDLLVVPMPGKASIYPDKLTTRLDGPLTSGPTQRLISALREAGIHVVNLHEAFAEARAMPDDAASPLYLQRDTHWSPQGMQVAVDAVADAIRAMGIAPGGTAEYDLRDVMIQRRGDIIRMMQIPQVEKLYERQSIDCTQVVSRSTGERFKPSASASILVLGDSFLRIYEQDEPQSAGFVAHLAYALKQPLDAIINDGGASTLVRQTLERTPQRLRGKRLVVWEFVERDIIAGREGWQKIEIPESPTPTTNTQISRAETHPGR